MESEFKYECNICFNEDILEKNIVYLNCLHYTCNSCFGKLKAPSCPFCRAEITLNGYKCDDDIFELENDYTTENIYNDFIVSLPTIRRDRQQSKRNKINKKKELLNSMIVEDENNLELDIPSSQTSRKAKKYNIRTSPINRTRNLYPMSPPSPISRSL
jgi:hypothetical protein